MKRGTIEKHPLHCWVRDVSLTIKERESLHSALNSCRSNQRIGVKRGKNRVKFIVLDRPEATPLRVRLKWLESFQEAGEVYARKAWTPPQRRSLDEDDELESDYRRNVDGSD